MNLLLHLDLQASPVFEHSSLSAGQYSTTCALCLPACPSVGGGVDSISGLTSYLMDIDDLFEFLLSVLWGHGSGSGHFNYVSSGEVVGIDGTHSVECPHHYLTPERSVSLETAPWLIKRSVFVSLSSSLISLESIFCPHGSVYSGHCR